MAVATGSASILLGLLLIGAGVAKFRSPVPLEVTLVALGLPQGFAPPQALLASLEIVLGVGLLLAPERLHLVVALGATVLMAVFVVLALLGVRRGGLVRCGCFGNSNGRLDRPAVARNAILLGLAALAMLGPAPIATFGSTGSLAYALVALGSAGIAALIGFRHGGETALSGPSEGLDSLEVLHFEMFDGEQLPWSFLADAPSHLVFFSARCPACADLVERFRWYPHALRPGHEIYPVLLGRPPAYADIPAFAPLIPHALYDPEKRIARALGMQGTPGTVLVEAGTPTEWIGGAIAIEQAVLRRGFFEEQR